MSNQIEQTISDIEILKEQILERHKSEPELCLRINSVFTQLVNSLTFKSKGTLAGQHQSSFKPQPIDKIAGVSIKKKIGPLKLKPIETNTKEAFREKIEIIYNSFVERDNTDLLDSLEEIEIRGVAKLAGVPDFEKAKKDGDFINRIKAAILAKAEEEKAKAETKEDLTAGKVVFIEGNDLEGLLKEAAPVVEASDDLLKNAPEDIDGKFKAAADAKFLAKAEEEKAKAETPKTASKK